MKKIYEQTCDVYHWNYPYRTENAATISWHIEGELAILRIKWNKHISLYCESGHTFPVKIEFGYPVINGKMLDCEVAVFNDDTMDYNLAVLYDHCILSSKFRQEPDSKNARAFTLNKQMIITVPTRGWKSAPMAVMGRNRTLPESILEEYEPPEIKNNDPVQ